MRTPTPAQQVAHYHALLRQHAYGEAMVVLLQVAYPLLHIGSTQHVLALLHALPPDERANHPQILILVGDTWRLRNDWQQAGAYYAQALAVAEERRSTVDRGLALCRQALLCWQRGDVDGAAALFEQANRVLVGVDERHAVWDELRTDYALALSSLGRLDEAEQLFQQQLRAFQRRAAAAGQRMILHNLGTMIYHRRGDFGAAEATLNEALHLDQQIGHRLGEAYVSNSLAQVLLAQGRSAEALALGLRAQSLGEALAVPNVIAYGYLNQAQALHGQGDHQAADHACEHALRYQQSALSSPLRCEILLTTSQLQRRRFPAQAHQTAHDALATARLQGDVWTTGVCLLHMAEAHLDRDQVGDAAATLVEAHTIFARYNDRYHLLRWRMLAARLAYEQQDWHAVGEHVPALLSNLNQYPALCAAATPVLAPLLAAAVQHAEDQATALHTPAVVWGDAFAPLAAALLAQHSSVVRAWTIDVLAQHGKPWAWALLADHEEAQPAVRTRIKAILKQAEAYPLPPLDLRCLGGFAVRHDTLALPADRWTSIHAQLVLVYLALRGPATRDELIDLLWPDEPVNKAGARLRTTIRLLRKTLNPPWHPHADYVCTSTSSTPSMGASTLPAMCSSFNNGCALRGKKKVLPATTRAAKRWPATTAHFSPARITIGWWPAVNTCRPIGCGSGKNTPPACCCTENGMKPKRTRGR